ncbi:ubiquitin-like modifier-activating enzyme ATG7 [Dysidea avara]|uniref:ubiquitin-like modifier-activating enzyme ATG7 n=1 Tax=Dysidea avara TaxID=196820 RepID=UPI0033290D53
MAQQDSGILQFASFCSTLDTGFWHKLSHKKLNEYKLNEGKVDIWGSYTNGDVGGLPTRLSLDYSAFEKLESTTRSYNSPGILLITNTVEKFKTTSKEKLLEETSQLIWSDICTGAAVTDPSLLTRFHLFTFANLKKYQYQYWFAFPALLPEKPVQASAPLPIKSYFTEPQTKSLVSSWDSFHQSNPGIGFFLVKMGDETVDIRLLTEFDQVYGKDPQKVVVGFCDPCTLESNPGWPLRNFLALIAKQWSSSVSQLSVLCFRDRTREGQRDVGHSLFYEKVDIPNFVVGSPNTSPKSVGWEKNAKDKLSHRKVDLSSSMDPVRLAESSVDLNLRLMKWRLMPSLDIQVIQETRCLLLGSGTLGCNVARCLIGWGIRNITLVDNGKVSYSNPARQSLFEFDDCANGGKPKAETAAEQLKKIFPGVNAKGVTLSIPMPGHTVGTTAVAIEAVQKDCKALEQLVESHDVVYLLMDTRESRWLPTLLTTTMGKLCINAALGFDTYMVMRHGYRPDPQLDIPAAQTGGTPGNVLGCYYCNDVVAPTDSTRDRTLDQQCTVSRPGLSMIAAALAVELMASVLQHPLKGLASADSGDDDSDGESNLGLVPHQIRGFLSRFQNVLPASRSFDKCTACSEQVVSCYKKEGFDFLLKTFNTPNFLEDLTGLSKLFSETLDDQVWELSDDEN